jgi:transposase-like protein
MNNATTPITFNSFASMLSALPDKTACRSYLQSKIWEGGVPTCPYCGSQEHYILKTKGEFKGMYKCAAKGCKKRYTVTIGTMFEGSHIPLRKWFIAIYIFSMHKKGISSHQLATDLGITQKSAWFVLHRIREAFGIDDSDLMGGEGVVVEVDETYHGGKNANMSNKKRKAIAEAKEARVEF